MIKIAVVGSSKFEDYELFTKVMDEYLKEFDDVEFISGGAKGTDELAYRYAKEWGIPIKIYFPKWRLYKNAAGYKRNKLIWQEVDRGIAFWDGKSKGTKHSFKLAKEFGKEIDVFDVRTKDFVQLNQIKEEYL